MQACGQVHGSCVSRDGDGVLLIGPAGSGKSDLALRLLGRGFDLVADDRVDIEDGIAAPPEALAGLLEVHGLGIVRLPYVASRPPRSLWRNLAPRRNACPCPAVMRASTCR